MIQPLHFALVCLCLLSTACSTLGTSQGSTPSLFVEVSGYGRNRNSALQDAFKNAIQKTYGVLITTQSRVDNDRLTKDVINEYSSAIINKYDLLSEGKDSANGYRVSIAALVSSSKLLDYMLANTKQQGPKKADGSQIYAQISTALRSKQQGDRLLESILTDFPKPALKASLGRLSSRIDQDRQVFLRIPYKIEWNSTYLESLRQITEYISVKKCPVATEDQYNCQYDVVFLGGSYSWSSRVGYKLADNIQADTFRSQIKPTIGLNVEFLDKSGTTLDKACVNLNLTQNYLKSPTFFGSANLSGLVPLVWDRGNSTAIGNFTLEEVMEIRVSNLNAIEKIQGIRANLTRECSWQ